MYLAGEIVTPDLCDHDSYKELGLVCPFCRLPVFFCTGSQYINSKQKEIIRNAHFSHFKIHSEQGRLCEARSITKAGRQEIERIDSANRQQRLLLFYRHFVDLLTVGWLDENGNILNIKTIKKKLSESDLKSYRSLAKSGLNYFRLLCKEYKTFDKFNVLSKINKEATKIAKSTKLQKELANIDLHFQVKICDEAMFFLENCSLTLFCDLIIVLITEICTVNSKNYQEKYIKNMLSGSKEYVEDIYSVILAHPWRQRIDTLRVEC